jgi:hydrogenase maturation protein HypF
MPGTGGHSPCRVQHHHAHIAACMAENKADGPVIGLAFDGTGLGTDNTIWGGEVLVADYHTFSRAAHLAPVPMPGSAAAIKEPWRMAVSHLRAAFGEGIRISSAALSRSQGNRG